MSEGNEPLAGLGFQGVPPGGPRPADEGPNGGNLRTRYVVALRVDMAGLTQLIDAGVVSADDIYVDIGVSDVAPRSRRKGVVEEVLQGMELKPEVDQFFELRCLDADSAQRWPLGWVTPPPPPPPPAPEPRLVVGNPRS